MHGAPQRLRCEYLDNPLGIEVARPRLSWWVNDGRPAEIQTAYQILAASTPDLLNLDEGDFWDPGRVESRDSFGIEYGGKPLVSARRVWWKVRSFDSDGLPSPWSDAASFEPGLLEPADWSGCWIGAPLKGSRVAGVPVPLLCRDFELPGAIRVARLYVAALGQVAVQLNGQPVSEAVLAPGWVDYSQRVEYLTIDVSDALRAGSNRLSVLLADGWYAGDCGTGNRQQYGERPWLLAELKVTMADGSRRNVATDSRWRWRQSGILAADPVAGECRDRWPAEAPGEGWLTEPAATEAADAIWFPVLESTSKAVTSLVPCAARIQTQAIERDIEGELKVLDDSRLVVAFANPLLGRVRINLKMPAGGVVRIRYASMLDAGDVLCGPITEDVYTAIGQEDGEAFEAIFSQHGFRYVELSGDIYHPEAVTVRAIAIRQPAPITAEFACDHAGLNERHADLAGHLRRTQQCVPLAGISPGERHGDSRVFGASIALRLKTMEATPLAVKWLQDMADAQFPTGGFPVVAPAPPGEEQLCRDGGAGASDAFVEVLWQVFRHSGDRRLLRTFFGNVRRFVNGVTAASPGFIREDPDHDGDCPGDLFATAWYYRSARLASRIAGVLGNLSGLEDFEELASHVRSAFARRFVTAEGRIVGDAVEVYVLALGFGLLEQPLEQQAARILFERCEQRLPTAAVPHLLDTLTRLGRLDLAYRVALDATAAPADPGVTDWLYASLAGFQQSRDLSERSNAFRHLVIQPRPPLGLGYRGGVESGEPPLRELEAALDTISGRFEIGWQISDDAFELACLVPANCTAEVVLPDGTRHDAAAGRHRFEMPFGEAGDGIPVLREVS